MAGVKKQQGPGLVIAIYSELGLGLVVFVRYVYESCNCVKSLLVFGPCTSENLVGDRSPFVFKKGVK